MHHALVVYTRHHHHIAAVDTTSRTGTPRAQHSASLQRTFVFSYNTDRACVVVQRLQHLSFPPRHLSEFVIRYRGTSFHVHQLVLHCNSEYFRTYLGSHNEGSTGHKQQHTDSQRLPPVSPSTGPTHAITRLPRHASSSSSSEPATETAASMSRPFSLLSLLSVALQVPALPAFSGHRSWPSSRDGVTKRLGAVSRSRGRGLQHGAQDAR
jgi:hypothetical protein